ncbi:hypothetical protein L228DRAFT_106578 [Xylona heveae TC161]|uniref:Uncharacterized protein n=1 Tax=Xylona heveae (strain CBS 132557 / TC161) TaxID=1328760 RepID=A0A165HAN5_XYLHT|nr:hypothetical protein L228DRAFT_106578 [Xylona heveae TC161]KZF23221.1 hypothetical protein L228DRAFT_106578 [Xylona heveae TC161]
MFLLSHDLHSFYSRFSCHSHVLRPCPLTHTIGLALFIRSFSPFPLLLFLFLTLPSTFFSRFFSHNVKRVMGNITSSIQAILASYIVSFYFSRLPFLSFYLFYLFCLALPCLALPCRGLPWLAVAWLDLSGLDFFVLAYRGLACRGSACRGWLVSSCLMFRHFSFWISSTLAQVLFTLFTLFIFISSSLSIH